MYNNIFTTDEKVTLIESLNLLIEKEQDSFDHSVLMNKLKNL